MADKNHDAMIKGAYSALQKKQRVDIKINSGNFELQSVLRMPDNDELHFLGSRPHPIAVDFPDGTTVYASLGNWNNCFGSNRSRGYAFGVSAFSDGRSNLAYNQKNIDIADVSSDAAHAEAGSRAGLKKALDTANAGESGRYSDEDGANFALVLENRNRAAKVQRKFVASYQDMLCKAYSVNAKLK